MLKVGGGESEENWPKLGQRGITWTRKGKNWEGSLTLPLLTGMAGYAAANRPYT